MDFMQARKEMFDGKRIRRKIWPKSQCIVLVDSQVKAYYKETIDYHLDLDDIQDDNWEKISFDNVKIGFYEAMRALYSGHKVKQNRYPNMTIFLSIDKKTLRAEIERENKFVPNLESFLSDDWVICVE